MTRSPDPLAPSGTWPVAPLDRRVRTWVQQHRSRPFDGAAAVLAVAGSAPAMSCIALGAAIWLRRRRGAPAALLLTPAIAVLLHQVGMRRAARARPPGGEEKRSGSFPSGHTTASTAVLTTLAVVLARERIVPQRDAVRVAIAAPALVGISRVYRDVHWATDVAAGWGVGVLAAALALTITAPLRRTPLSTPE